MKARFIKGNERKTIRPMANGKFEITSCMYLTCRKAYGCKTSREVDLQEATEIYNRLINKGYIVEPII